MKSWVGKNSKNSGFKGTNKSCSSRLDRDHLSKSKDFIAPFQALESSIFFTPQSTCLEIREVKASYFIRVSQTLPVVSYYIQGL